MNISEFLEGQELTVYANKRFEKVSTNLKGKLSLMFKLLVPLGFLIVLDKATGTSMLSTSIITVLSIIYFIIALFFANTELRKLSKADKVQNYELEELANSDVKVKFLHENLSFEPKEIEHFEKTLKTIALFRENVTCEKVELDVDSLVAFENHKVVKNIIFTDTDTKEQFLVGILLDISENVTYYSEYKVENGLLDQTKVVLKQVEKDTKSISILN